MSLRTLVIIIGFVLLTMVLGSPSNAAPAPILGSDPAIAEGKSATAAETSPIAPLSGCSIIYCQSDWDSGAIVNVTIVNHGLAVIDGWTLNWNFPGNQRIMSMWNGTYIQKGAAVTVTNAFYNGAIPAQGAVSFGFSVSYSGANAQPSCFTINGANCPNE